MTAWQLIGSVYTTDSAAGPDKLSQNAMAKSTAMHAACCRNLHEKLVISSRSIFWQNNSGTKAELKG